MTCDEIVRFWTISQANKWLSENPRYWYCNKWVDDKGMICFSYPADDMSKEAE